MTHTLWTVGHSTRSIEEFLCLLSGHGIRMIVDVRRFPFSRRHPHFQIDSLSGSLRKAGLEYLSLPPLGGRRSRQPESENDGWRNAGFRGFADYMQTPPFWKGLEILRGYAEEFTVAMMCAEALPWKCHRFLVADAVMSTGWRVRHIIDSNRVDAHEMTSFAQVKDGLIVYPKP